MKKLLTFLAIAALVAVSCAKEQNGIIEEDGPLANISFTVNSAELMTKADPVYAQATAINELLVQVFNKVGDDFVKVGSPDVTITEQTPSTTPKSWIVEMKLAKNETYKIAFWAQKADTGIYGTTDLSAVTVDYSKIKINNDDADAFCAARLVTVTGAISQTVKLYRPLAQINIGTNDLEAYKKSVPAAKQNLTATITLPVGTPNKLNVIGGPESEGVVKSAVSGTATEPVVFTTAPAYVMSGATLVSSSVPYDYLTMLYVLAAPGKETMDYKFKLNNGSTDVSDITVANMPYQANYRTNVVGQLLTGSFTYTVEIEEGMYGDYEKKVAPSFDTLADLNTYLSNMQEGTSDGDNGDINPEQVVLTAMGAVTGTPKIVLPKIHGDVDIRLAFEFDGTLQIEYADGATDAQKPANIYFYAQKLNTLEATVPASHFELLSGSIVTNKAIVSTNATTFVIQNGARVGTAEIQKGNAHIAGTVATVSVPTGAKADDDNNPVQIFLENESAVEQIVLNAATDVVVEQPKDNIEVSGTEYKVKVDVNANNCSAKAQNGGQIYVVVADGVSNCTVSADGESEAHSASGATIAEVGTGSTVDTYEGGEGVVTINTGVDPSQVNEKDYEAKIGNVYYEKVQQAFEAAIVGDTVVVLVEEYTKINSGTYVLDPAAYVADGYLSYPNADGTFTVVPGILVQHNGTDDTDKNHTANGTLIKNAVEGAAEGTSIYLTSGIYWLPGNDFRFPDNKSFSIIGIGNVQIFSNGYGFAVNKSEHEGIAVTLKNLTITNGPNKPNAVYIKDYMVLTLEDVVLHNYAVTNKYSIVLDSSNPIDNAFDSNKTTTVIAKNVSIDEGLKIGLMAMPRQYYIDKGYSATISTKCSVTYDGKCVNFEGNVEAQNGEPCSTGSNLIVNGVALPEPPVAPTEFNVSTPAEFIAVFSDNAIRTKNTQININADIDLSDAEAHSPIDISNMDKASITVNGNNHIIKGMKKPMFDQCFVASIAVNDLTFKDCSITEASDGYVAVIAAYYDAGKFLNVENVIFDNCDLTGSNYAGLIYGAGGGYGNQNDGPVHMGALVKGCTATGCDLVSTGGGSVGAIAGHAAWNDWTKLTVENCTVTNCTMTTSKAVKAGSFFGTVGIAGSVVYGRQCGIYLKNCEWSGNVATAMDVVSPYIFGRVAQNGGELYVYDSVESDYVLAAYNHGSGDVVEREDLVSENRFSSQQ